MCCWAWGTCSTPWASSSSSRTSHPTGCGAWAPPSSPVGSARETSSTACSSWSSAGS
ncbi:hypothetical protein PR202_ga30685 [Eleusine coracana subsp. coracana]|uniref:Uncharacterized protein n=1 Tax=Eleusine coracana subsp. coracana TaxID=191504 RepID=A0AAV5DPK9_ELECO|nr:hypothetical protein PR202_ga30685 [Eleusine coracana subsp. coracana]